MVHWHKSPAPAYDAGYLEEIRVNMRKLTREKLRALFRDGTGKDVPKGKNLRELVSRWHAHQQAINAGASPSRFWRACNV